MSAGISRTVIGPALLGYKEKPASLIDKAQTKLDRGAVRILFQT